MAEIAYCLDELAMEGVCMMYSGIIRRCPDVSIILAHADGALPMVARRIEEMSVVYAADAAATSVEETIESRWRVG